MTPPRGVVFDLDDTLYLERDYVASGFRRVAGLIAQRAGGTVEDWVTRIQASSTGPRGMTFDRLLAAHPRLTRHFDLAELVASYREHEPSIRPLPGMVELLAGLEAEGASLGIITDGPPQSQTRKLRALDLGRWIDTAILTGLWDRSDWKPSPRAFEHLARLWGLAPGALTYVGDNPVKDFFAPRRLGWSTVRLRLSGQLHAHAEGPSADHSAHREARSVAELSGVLSDA